MKFVKYAQLLSKNGLDGNGCMIPIKLFIHNFKFGKCDKIKLYTELYTLSTGNYVNPNKNKRKNKNKGFVNKF